MWPLCVCVCVMRENKKWFWLGSLCFDRFFFSCFFLYGLFDWFFVDMRCEM